MTTDYVPIDCDQHSLLELLAMRRTAVTLRASGEGGEELIVEGVVGDVVTRGGAEYLILLDPVGEATQIRLDRLLALYDAGGTRVWCQKTA